MISVAGLHLECVVDLLVGGIGPDLMALSISARKAWTLPGGAMAQVPAMSGRTRSPAQRRRGPGPAGAGAEGHGRARLRRSLSTAPLASQGSPRMPERNFYCEAKYALSSLAPQL